ncbi:glycoside hydrolase family 5 protein [Acidomyces richmondensis BFW]|nr:glycoside hydrolase family 5 protein [Acidomyces richmondensis BFW]
MAISSGRRDGGLARLLLASGALVVGGAEAVIRGVNLGGWLVTEPWMTPTLYQSTNTTCEWDLCNALGKQDCLTALQQHWSCDVLHPRRLPADEECRAKCVSPWEGISTWTPDRIGADTCGSSDSVRIPLGYWAVNLLDYEPYVSGQYPYLLQAVEWAKQMDFTVLIDLHGIPGSQNGWEESGLVGAIAYPDNTTNEERTLSVLKNLTAEFSQPYYNGVVTNIEIVNEPIFAYQPLITLYEAGAQVIGVANNSGINTTIHDAFYNPPFWKNFDPWHTGGFSDAPAPHATVDTHQFWAFPPLNNLSAEQILERVCEFGKEIKAPNSGIPPTLVGEWSLDTGYTANSSTNTAEDVHKRTWFRKLFEAQNAAYTPNGPNESSIGWYFWAWKTEYDIDAWSYRKGVAEEYIPSNVSDKSTYIFPVQEDGCIDVSFDYTAPASVTNYGGSGGTSPTSTAPSASATAGSSSSSTKKSDAGSLSPGMLTWVAVGSIVLSSIC